MGNYSKQNERGNQGSRCVTGRPVIFRDDRLRNRVEQINTTERATQKALSHTTDFNKYALIIDYTSYASLPPFLLIASKKLL